MSNYTSITIIYNPHSTGAGERLARKLATTLAKELPSKLVALQATEYAGHGEDLAYALAKATARPLIISSSGDGGYNEVINGALKAQAEGAHPTTSLLPAGNANDHWHWMHKKGLTKHILASDERNIDVLDVKTQHSERKWQRYAHSYAGIGVTPQVGAELNKVELNSVNEKWVTFKAFLAHRGVQIIVDGSERRYDSLVFSNIGQMSKFLTLARKAKIDDGKFEVLAHRSQSKWILVGAFAKAAIASLDRESRSVKAYQFETIRPLRIQLDGEVFPLEAETKVEVSIRQKLLRCII